MMTQSLDEPGDDNTVEDWWDEGPKKASALRERMCMVRRTRMPVARMIRFVRAPDGSVIPDLTARLPGRGVWLHSDREVIASAATPKGGFSRGFKDAVQVDQSLVEQVERQLVERCQSTLGLAKRSGGIILGYDQVRSEVQKRKPGWLIEASDGALDGRRRVVGLAVAMYDRVRVASALTSEELGMAFGRDHVVHALLKTGRFTDVWTGDYRRLYEFRQMTKAVWVSGTVE